MPTEAKRSLLQRIEGLDQTPLLASQISSINSGAATCQNLAQSSRSRKSSSHQAARSDPQLLMQRSEPTWLCSTRRRETTLESKSAHQPGPCHRATMPAWGVPLLQRLGRDPHQLKPASTQQAATR
ncbi:hypothetical protein A0H81_07484 [Grifola frondosa]|uniref:Uncharacterized protein n=1 Tax=Grifola frondosa TaxID=5627 RepID=A0A1C7M7F1_GRIFR|nr:hypothetical protein A0H81_07484 [Grifola frondosa]